jgi:hypothetical protein
MKLQMKRAPLGCTTVGRATVTQQEGVPITAQSMVPTHRVNPNLK